MDDQQLTEQQFNEIAKRVIATAPEGLDEAQFNALLDAEVDKFLAKPPASRQLPAPKPFTVNDVYASVDAGSGPTLQRAAQRGLLPERPFLQRVGSGMENAVSGTAQTLWRVSGIPGVIREGPMGAIKDQFGVVKDVVDAQVGEYKKAKAAEAEGRTGEMIKRSVAAGVPMLGPLAAHWSDMIREGQTPEMLGEAIVAGGLPLMRRPVNVGLGMGAKAPAAVARGARSMVSNAVDDIAAHPAEAIAGAIGGGMIGGIPGAIKGAAATAGVGAGWRGAGRLLDRVLRRKPEVDQEAYWAQEAKNLNARDAYFEEMAKDLTVHQRLLEKMRQAATRAQLEAAKKEYQEVLQHAKNLNAREKKLAQMASEESAALREAELFPDGGEVGPASQRIISRRTKDGVTTTTSQTVRQSGESPRSPTHGGPPPLQPSPAAQEFLNSVILPRLESSGLYDPSVLARELSRKAILTPEEAAQLKNLNARMGLSASEVGMTHAAAGSPRSYVNTPSGPMIDPRRLLEGLMRRRRQ